MSAERNVDVLIIGGGPAGLSAAHKLRKNGVQSVTVCERAPQAGGIPRYTEHIGYGYNDLYRLMSGPSYAHKLVQRAQSAGVEILTETTADSWPEDRTVCTTGPKGLCHIKAQAILLATGCRETPRTARLIPGTRPAGIFTTSSLQHFQHSHKTQIGNRAIIMGAEHVSFSAVHTLHKLGCKTVAMVTPHARHQTYTPLKWITADRHSAPVITGAKVTDIIGKRRVEAVEITDINSGTAHTREVDTIVFTGGFIPEYEQAYASGAAIDRHTQGPAVDQFFRTNREGVFAAGNVLRGAEAAGYAAWEGIYVADAISAYLKNGGWPERTVPIICKPPLRCVSPNRILPYTTPAPFWLVTWRVEEIVHGGTLTITQDGRQLIGRRLGTLLPNRRLELCSTYWMEKVDPNGSDVIAQIVS